MTHTTRLHPPPAYTTVIGRQAWLLLVSWRGPVLAGSLVGLVLMLDATFRTLTAGSPGPWPPAVVEILGWFWALGVLWGTGVWREETPAKRGYHTSLPVDRAAHDLARVLAGAAWLVGCVALVLTVGALAAARGGQLGVVAALPAWVWVGAFTAPLLTYTLTSAFAVALNRPLEWMLLGLVTVFALAIAAEWAGVGWLLRGVGFVAGGDYGLATAVAHPAMSARRLFLGVNPAIGVDDAAIVQIAALDGRWLASLAAWATVAVGALAFALTRRRLG
jgi:hypothetical protein